LAGVFLKSAVFKWEKNLSSDEQIKNYQDILRQYSILNLIAKIVSSTLDLNKILRIILSGVTFGDGFGFNRAFLFLIDRQGKHLVGRMAIGPATPEDAWKIWNEIQQKTLPLEEFLMSEKFNTRNEISKLDEEIRKIRIDIDPDKVLFMCLQDGIPRNVDLTQNIPDSENSDIVSDIYLFEQNLLDYLDYPKFCIIPLISRSRKVGVMIVDNKYSHRQIKSEDINFLLMLSQFAASSIRNTIIYNDLKDSLNALAKLNLKHKYLKEYNEKILESIPVSIIVLDHNMTVTMCNENSAGIMGTEKVLICGKKIETGMIHIDSIDLMEEVSLILANKRTQGFYKVNVKFNNHISNDVFDVMLVPFKFSEETPEGVLIIIEDVTKTVKLEQSLNEAKRLSELGKLSATVAHEIRNPLIAIGGYANRIKKKYLEKGELNPENIEVIITEVARLEKIVNETLEFASERKTEFKDFSICALLVDCINLTSTAAEQSNISINIKSGAELIKNNDIFIHGSYDTLKQAFINVINNAIEASETRDVVSIEIVPENANENSFLVIKINNKAKLTSETDMNNIFLPFYTTKSKGTGLGLTITKRIVEKHKGTIDVFSDLETGTTFTVKLPVLKTNQ
jgi:PAS domain S-box-containing protein